MYTMLQIRAASLSGDCFYWKENFARLNFGWRAHHQVIVIAWATLTLKHFGLLDIIFELPNAPKVCNSECNKSTLKTLLIV